MWANSDNIRVIHKRKEVGKPARHVQGGQGKSWGDAEEGGGRLFIRRRTDARSLPGVQARAWLKVVAESGSIAAVEAAAQQLCESIKVYSISLYKFAFSQAMEQTD